MTCIPPSSSQSVIVTSSKLLVERINTLAMRFDASASYVYQDCIVVESIVLGVLAEAVTLSPNRKNAY